MRTALQTLFFFLLVTQMCFAQWYQQNSGTTSQLLGVSFIDANNGTVVGVTGTILHTTDGGETWTTQSSGTLTNLFDISFTDLNNGTAVGDEGTILRSTNGGTTWMSQSSGTTVRLSGVSFTDANNGTIVGYGGKILRTTNGGTIWISQSGGTINNLESVSFPDINFGVAVGHNGTIISTSNGGASWVNIYLFGNDLRAVSFHNIEIGNVVGESGYISRTTNGGENWIYQNSGWDFPIYGISLVDSNLATAVGYWGWIIRTTDGGENWITQTSGTNNILYGVSFTDANNGTAVGDNGTILHTTNGGVVPIELNSFAATANGKEVTLAWLTAIELNNYGFEIQRKAFGGEFATVAFVKGQGTTTQQNQYNFVDKYLDEGKYFYRLKQIDYGGQFSYSQIVEVDVRMLDKYTLEQNYPNPFNPTTTIGFGIMEKGNVRLSVLNILGEEIKNLLNEEKETGYHLVDFNASELPSGVYFYRIQVYPANSGAGNPESSSGQVFIDTKKMILLR